MAVIAASRIDGRRRFRLCCALNQNASDTQSSQLLHHCRLERSRQAELDETPHAVFPRQTTFATEFLPHYADCPNFINPDLIARGLSPFDPNAAMVRAGRVVLQRIRESMHSKRDFAFETTLSGRAYATLIKELRQTGY